MRLHPATEAYKRLQSQRVKNVKSLPPSFVSSRYDGIVQATARLLILKDFSKVVLDPISFDVLRERRRMFNSIKNKKFPLKGENCWVCRDRAADHRHHVVLLKHGGSITGRKNVVFLCEFCHCDIHPWIEPTRVKTQVLADFELARNKNEAAALLERAAKGRFSTIEEPEILLKNMLHNVFNILQNKD